MLRATLTTLVLCTLAACHSMNRTTTRASDEHGIIFRSIDVGGRKHLYAVYIPREYDASRNWPCIVFLNGKGECGIDGSRQLAVGLCPAILAEPQRWPCVAIFPQKPDQESAWADHDAMVMVILSKETSLLSIDPSRVLLTGLSQGGAGTWAIGSNHPDTWAAIAPVCGYGDPGAVAPRLTTMPVWAFHGLKDDVVKPEQTTAMVEAIKTSQASKPGAVPPKMTLFPNANHNAWDPAYRGEELAPWLLSQRRQK